MKKVTTFFKFYFLLALVIFFTLITSPSLAVTATPSAKKTSESTSSSSLATKLNALKEEIASKAAQIKQNVTKKIQNKAFFGIVSDINENTLSLETISGKKIVLTNEYTEYSSKLSTKKKISLETIQESDALAALGDMDDKNNLVAKKIIILPKVATDSAKLTWGQIQSLSGSTIIIKDRDNQTKNIKTSFATNFFLGPSEASLTDAKKGKYLVAKGVPQGNGTTINSNYIFFIPSTGFVKPEKKVVASPSAEIKISPSPSPKKKT